MANLFMFLSAFSAFAAVPVFSITGDNVPEMKPAFRKLYLTQGASQQLNCSVNATGQETKLKWNPPTMDGVIQIDESILTTSMLTLRSSLKVENFTKANAGTYTCSLMKNDKAVNYATIQLIHVNETKSEPLFVRDNKVAILSCLVDFENPGLIRRVTWLKHDLIISHHKDSHRFTILEENNTLIIDSPTREDAGLYIARFDFNDSQHPYDCEVQYQAGPLVLRFEKSKNLIEGDNLDLQCIVKGYPYPDITWYKDEELLNRTERIIMRPLHGYLHAHLLIEDVNYSDAGVYTCRAYSSLFPNETKTQTIIVRVKDKLAALWPFLGIVGEVVVLCTIIFLYEKRRSKQVQLEETAAQEVDGTAVDKKEGLRHRNTNNPTA